MTLLVISPDYASHLLPLATLAAPWREAGDRVVVATGPATDRIVNEFGFERIDLRLGRGSNPGVIRAEEQVRAEDEALRGFFAATEQGMLATLAFQADARRTDLLWRPEAVAAEVLDIVRRVGPDQILVDHLAFSARLALQAAGISHADVVLGHPSALPVGDEVYGYPTAWPAAFDPDQAGLRQLRVRCEQVQDAFTADWNAALGTVAAAAGNIGLPRVATDAFAEHGDLLLYNYPAPLHDPARTAALPPHAFLGSAVRPERLPGDVARWLDDARRPIVVVSFGSFLSARADVLRMVAAALARLDVEVAVGVGSADRDVLGQLPAHWLVREYLPQVALLERAALLVTHGGNNSVTESLTAGVPMLVLPFSTDQFAGAAAVEAAGVGAALDPNALTAGALTAAIGDVLGGAAPAAAAGFREALTAQPGPQVALEAMRSARPAR